MIVSVNDLGDHVCEHGTALDVHCCNCHNGFIFDVDHECEPMTETKGYPCGCSATGTAPLPTYCPTHCKVLGLHRCTVCGTRWLLWPDAVHGGGWNLLDKYQRPGSCCDNVAMGDQIEHLRDFDLSGLLGDPEGPRQTEKKEDLSRVDGFPEGAHGDLPRPATE